MKKGKMRKIEATDIDRVSRMIRAKYDGSSASVCSDDFVAAGLFGLVCAAHEYDEARGGWVTLWRWRAEEKARDLLRWALRTEADVSLNAVTCNRELGALLQSEDYENECVHRDAVCCALEHVTGNIRHAIARAHWLEREEVPSIAARFCVKLNTAYSHLTYARKQVAEALAKGWIDPALCGVGIKMMSGYDVERSKSAKVTRARIRRQNNRAQNARILRN